MEKLAALCCLWAFGLSDKDDYAAELDRLFLESSEDDFLLELENLDGDYRAAWSQISPHIGSDVTIDGFGKELFAALEKIYVENRFPLAEFGRICNALWRFLPSEFNTNEPFNSLIYADEPLSWGDEKQARELYQAAYDFYKEV